MKSRVVKIQSWNGFWWPGDRVADGPASQVAAVCRLVRGPRWTERPAVCPSCPVAMPASGGHRSCSRKSQQPVCRLSACEPQTCHSKSSGAENPESLEVTVRPQLKCSWQNQWLPLKRTCTRAELAGGSCDSFTFRLHKARPCLGHR